MRRPMSVATLILYILILAAIILAILAVRAEPASAKGGDAHATVQGRFLSGETTIRVTGGLRSPTARECDDAPRLCYWRRLDGDFHKSLRAATRFWGVSYDWLHACAHSEGGHGPKFVWGSDGAGSFGPFQYLSGTFAWMSNEAWKATRRKGLRIPIGYKRIDSMVGQTWTAAWAFSHGLSYHWYGRGC